jgi:hypothetical protein
MQHTQTACSAQHRQTDRTDTRRERQDRHVRTRAVIPVFVGRVGVQLVEGQGVRARPRD